MATNISSPKPLHYVPFHLSSYPRYLLT